MKTKIGYLALAAAMALAPVSPASAYDRWGHHHHGDGPILGLFALGAAVVVGTAAILTAPVRAIAEAPGPEYYAPPPQQPYYQQQAYYAPQPVYYAPPPPVYYAAGPGYYAPRPYYYGR